MLTHKSSAMTAASLTALLALSLAAPAFAGDEPFTRDRSDPASSFAMRDKAGNEQQHLIVPADQPGKVAGERCMPKTRLCFSIEGDAKAPVLRIRKVNEPGAAAHFTLTHLPLDFAAPANAELSIWSLGFRRARAADATGEAMIIGVEALTRLTLSGGGAHKSRLWLYRIDNAGEPGAVAAQALSVPAGAQRSVRACFNKADEARRLGACQDEIEIEALLVMDDANSDPMPRMIHRVFTNTYPLDLPLRSPDQQPQQLTDKQLFGQSHAACTYDRKVIWSPATARYEFDRPAPDCKIFGLEQ